VAQVTNLTVDQGSNIVLFFTLQRLTDESLPLSASNPLIAYDLSGLNIRMQVRKSYNSSTVLMSASTADSKITIEGLATEGTFQVEFPAADSSAISFDGPELDCVYDIELFTNDDPEVVRRVVQGTFTLSREVTR
jgi:hypothetical protein